MAYLMPLRACLNALAQQDPERPALIACAPDGSIMCTITRAQLLAKLDAAAAYFAEQGVGTGERVALSLPNCPELLILSWAAWSSGVVTVPLDTKRDTDELRAYKLQASNAKLVIDSVPQLPDASRAPEAQDPNALALILFTSGTTARPKGAMLTMHNLLTNAKDLAAWLSINSQDRFIVELPLHHINSTTFCLATIMAGGSIAIPPQYSHSMFWQQAAKAGATLTSLVPSILHDQLGRQAEFAAAQETLLLSRIQIGSAPVVPSVAKEFIEHFGIPLYQGYGQTETSLRVTGVPTDLRDELYRQMLAENSIGTPMPWATVEAASPEGAILKEGEEGELVVKGAAVMQGYLGHEPAFRDGWFLTGDIGYWKLFDNRRFFFLKGRAKEIVIKGGVNISPVAVEDSLKKISREIAQAYVVGADDDRYGEVVAAALVWKDGVDPTSAMRSLKFKLLEGTPHLSAYETPDYLASIPAGNLPTTSTGKVQRSKLKEDLAGSFERLDTLAISANYRFVAVLPQSPVVPASLKLYNRCWQPLTQSPREYQAFLKEHITVAALDSAGLLAGQITIDSSDKRITCISICSGNFVPKPVPEMSRLPSLEEVKQYVQGGEDPVMQFHAKLGAQLMELIPQGRPEDKSSLGYTMLLRYPAASDVPLAGSAPAQLIALARTLGKDMGMEVYALSRPGGLAQWIAAHP